MNIFSKTVHAPTFDKRCISFFSIRRTGNQFYRNTILLSLISSLSCGLDWIELSKVESFDRVYVIDYQPPFVFGSTPVRISEERFLFNETIFTDRIANDGKSIGFGQIKIEAKTKTLLLIRLNGEEQDEKCIRAHKIERIWNTEIIPCT